MSCLHREQITLPLPWPGGASPCWFGHFCVRLSSFSRGSLLEFQWALVTQGKQLQEQSGPQPRPGQGQRDNGSRGPGGGDTQPGAGGALGDPLPGWKGGRGWLTWRVRGPHCRRRPLPSSLPSPLTARSAVWGERWHAGQRHGLLKAIFRGEQAGWETGMLTHSGLLYTEPGLFSLSPEKQLPLQVHVFSPWA